MGSLGGITHERIRSSMGCQEDYPRIKTRLEDDSFSPQRRSRRLECTWTNFHCVFFLGVGGFLFFWIFILLRMYLPVENAIMAWWIGGSKAGTTTATNLPRTTVGPPITDQE